MSINVNYIKQMAQARMSELLSPQSLPAKRRRTAVAAPPPPPPKKKRTSSNNNNVKKPRKIISHKTIGAYVNDVSDQAAMSAPRQTRTEAKETPYGSVRRVSKDCDMMINGVLDEFAVNFFDCMQASTTHANRKTVKPRDIDLYKEIRNK